MKEKRTKNNKIRAVFVLLLVLMFGCENFPTSDEYEQAKNDAITIAENELSRFPKNVTEWTENAYISDAFPVYLEGVSEPSYFECKVSDVNNVDAGYFLININQTDIPVVEAIDTGLTLNETYQDMLGKANIKVYRYDYTKSTAVASGSTSRSMNKKPMAKIGFNSEDELEEISKIIREKGCSPYYNKKDLANLSYTLVEPNSRGNDPISIGNSLYYSYKKKATPTWDQFIVTDKNHNVGCGAIAWAQALAYFQAFKGKTNIFPGINVIDKWNYDSYIIDCNLQEYIEEIAETLHTLPVGELGMVGASNMRYIVRYLATRGYTATYDRSAAATYGKFDKVYASILADKPVVILIHARGIGVLDHYVTIERAYKEQVYKLGKYRDGDWVKYYCNFGWGEYSVYKWIYAKGDSSDDETPEAEGKRHSTYDIWTIDF